MLDKGPVPKIPYYIFASIPQSETQNTSGPKLYIRETEAVLTFYLAVLFFLAFPSLSSPHNTNSSKTFKGKFYSSQFLP